MVAVINLFFLSWSVFQTFVWRWRKKLIGERYRGLLRTGKEPGESSGGWQSRIPLNMPLECKDYF